MENVKRIVRELQAAVRRKPTLNETGVTQRVARHFKESKSGLFQNEVDYRIFWPEFRPADPVKRSRLDLAGFMAGELLVVEVKVYDEKIKTKNPWGVLY